MLSGITVWWHHHNFGPSLELPYVVHHILSAQLQWSVVLHHLANIVLQCLFWHFRLNNGYEQVYVICAWAVAVHNALMAAWWWGRVTPSSGHIWWMIIKDATFLVPRDYVSFFLYQDRNSTSLMTASALLFTQLVFLKPMLMTYLPC